MTNRDDEDNELRLPRSFDSAPQDSDQIPPDDDSDADLCELNLTEFHFPVQSSDNGPPTLVPSGVFHHFHLDDCTSRISTSISREPFDWDLRYQRLINELKLNLPADVHASTQELTEANATSLTHHNPRLPSYIGAAGASQIQETLAVVNSGDTNALTDEAAAADVDPDEGDISLQETPTLPCGQQVVPSDEVDHEQDEELSSNSEGLAKAGSPAPVFEDEPCQGCGANPNCQTCSEKPKKCPSKPKKCPAEPTKCVNSDLPHPHTSNQETTFRC